MNVELYEIEYSCSPGGVDMWAVDVRDSIGHSIYQEFRSSSSALKWLLNKYPDKEINLTIRSIAWFHKEMSEIDDMLVIQKKGK
jgi:hypothetical protein